MRRYTWHDQLDNLPDYLRLFIRLLALLLHPGEVLELRILYPNRLINGYFDDPARLVAAVREHVRAVEIQVTVNPVRWDLLRMAYNELRQPAGWQTREQDVARRAALVIPFRTTDHATTAVNRATACRTFLASQNWPEPVLVDSGRSFDLIYAVTLPNAEVSTALIHQVLTTLDARFSDDDVWVDTTAYEASVLIPVYGTLVAGSAQRSAVVHLPDPLIPVDGSQLEALVQLPVAAPAEGDPIRQFVMARCVLDIQAWTATGVLHYAYTRFCNEFSLPVVPVNSFARSLITAFQLTGWRRKVRGVVVRGIAGIRLRNTS